MNVKYQANDFIILLEGMEMACVFLTVFTSSNRLINHVMKNGSSLANTLGIVSVMYSGFGVILSWARGTDDSLNTLGAATATGMLFKSTCTFAFAIFIELDLLRIENYFSRILIRY